MPPKSKSKSKPPKPEITVDEIPLSRPPPASQRDPNRKTLIELIDEHHPQLSGEQKAGEGADGEYTYGRLEEAFYITMPLIILYGGLDVMCHQQYLQPVDMRETTFASLRAFPVLLTLIYMLHRRRNNYLVKALFFGFSVSAGMWMVHATNRYGYFAVMKKAPGVGTIWVWSVVELDAVLALVSLLVTVGFFWWGDYQMLAS